jgi:hypothetical protein
MVLPVKVFEIRGMESDPGTKLTGFQEAEPVKEEEIELLTRILDSEKKDEIFFGIFAKDYLRETTYRRQIITNATTEEAPFWFVHFNKRNFLIVMAPSVARGVKKLLSNHVAVKIGEILNVDIRESKISSETLKNLHESNPNSTNLIWFDNIDLPGVNKLCLSGEGLSDTRHYKEYLDHGMIWYVVFKSQKSGYTVGITRNAVVTNFSKSTIEDFIDFIREEIITLID